MLVKDTQEDILSGRVNHIDFYAIHAGQKTPYHGFLSFWKEALWVSGKAVFWEHKIEELEVICLPKDIPENFKVDISGLGIGDSLHVGRPADP